MHRPFHSAEATQDLALAIVRRHIPDPAYRVFLFGSRASGTHHPASDIDLGIEGPEPIPYATLVAIREELENAPTLYSVDLVDFGRVPIKFKDVARARSYLEPNTP